MGLVVVDTCEGPCAVAYGECRVCGWCGWGTFDIGLVPTGDGAWEHDENPEAACPRCTLTELDVRIDGPSSA